jgi:hypothetical protein
MSRASTPGTAILRHPNLCLECSSLIAAEFKLNIRSSPNVVDAVGGHQLFCYSVFIKRTHTFYGSLKGHGRMQTRPGTASTAIDVFLIPPYNVLAAAYIESATCEAQDVNVGG